MSAGHRLDEPNVCTCGCEVVYFDNDVDPSGYGCEAEGVPFTYSLIAAIWGRHTPPAGWQDRVSDETYDAVEDELWERRAQGAGGPGPAREATR